MTISELRLSKHFVSEMKQLDQISFASKNGRSEKGNKVTSRRSPWSSVKSARTGLNLPQWNPRTVPSNAVHRPVGDLKRVEKRVDSGFRSIAQIAQIRDLEEIPEDSC